MSDDILALFEDNDKQEFSQKESKRCGKCKELKPVSDFYYRKNPSPGFSSYCKKCIKGDRKRFYQENDVRLKENARNKYWSDPDFYREQITANTKERRERLYKDIRHRISRSLDSIRDRCKKADILCNLTIDYLYDLYVAQKRLCVLTGRIMSWGEAKDNITDRDAASVDRVVPDLGYVAGNVRFITYQANFAKNRLDDEDLLEFCNLVISFHGSDPETFGKIPYVPYKGGDKPFRWNSTPAVALDLTDI